MTNFPIGKLRAAMDAIINDFALQPDQPKKGVTYCNIGTFKLVQSLGFPYFWNETSDRPMMANEMVDYMDTHPLQFSKLFNPLTAYDMANNGYLVLAALKEQPHGHICAVAPIQQLVTSGHFKCQVPMVCNIGKKNEYMGLNYAFAHDMPNFYICL